MELIDRVILTVQEDMSLPDSYLPKIKRYVKQARQGILNFTHLGEVPEGLEYVWVDATSALMKEVLGSSDPLIGGEREQTVTSIQEGDTSVSFGGTQTNVSSLEADALSSVITDIRSQLVQYRRVKFS